jgi:CheY-like chemotaxis protein
VKARILLADDSPHAQRMGERILREEGYEVVSVTDGDTAMIRLPDVQPDLVIADAFLPGKSGFEISRFLKSDSRLRRIRIVLTAGLLEEIDEQQAREAGADAVMRKPFEASAMADTVKTLIEAAQFMHTMFPREEAVETTAESTPESPASQQAELSKPPELVVLGHPKPEAGSPEPATLKTPERERVRAAVILALESAMPVMIEEITDRVLESMDGSAHAG